MQEITDLLDPPTIWKPFPNSPQEQAYHCLADEIWYGGGGGGGKTSIGVGLAITAHRRSLLLRREAVDTKEIVDQLKKHTAGTNAHWKGIGPFGGVLTTEDGRVVEVAGCANEDDKLDYQGRPHDLFVFDEAPHFSPTQIQFITQWNRHEDPNQRCRVVLTGNPPTRPEDRWIIEWFAPWIDEEYPERCPAGKRLWYRYDAENKLVWMKEPEPYFEEALGKMVTPRSRTFIPALLKDNPILLATNYGDMLANAPEPLRSQLLYGDMSAGVQDDAWQVIPTEWVRKSMKRWTPNITGPMTSVGVDVARGGAAKTVISPKHGRWFGKLKKIAGKDTPDGPAVAKEVVKVRTGSAIVLIDVVGVGSSAYDFLKGCNWFRTIPVNNAERTIIDNMRDRSGRMRFMNVRAASWWRMRESLDPANPEAVALPPDNELLADLCAPRYEVMTSGIKVEPKEDVIERLGRSPDCGDAAVLANFHDHMQRPGTVHVVTGMPKLTAQGQLKIVAVSLEKLPEFATDNSCLLVTILDPIAQNEPKHALDELLASLSLSFADVDPADHQAEIDSPLEPYGKPAGEVAMGLQHGKDLWKFLLKKREPMAEVFVIAGAARIPFSLAQGVCSVLHIDPAKTIFMPEYPESKEEAVNRHISALTKATRGSVI